MSRVAVHSALVSAVSLDSALYEVRDFDHEPDMLSLPSAAVVYIGDRPAGQDPERGREYLYSVRIYAHGRNLKEAQAELMARADALDENLAAQRRLTERAEVVSSLEGQMGTDIIGSGEGVLPYTVTVVIRIRPANKATLADGVTSIEILDVVRETLASRETYTEVMRDVDSGALIAYENDAGQEQLEITGRVASQSDAEQIVAWYAADEALSFTDQAGVTSAGWQIAGDPRPDINRTEEGESFTVGLILWRL